MVTFLLRVVSGPLRAMILFRRQDFCYDHMRVRPFSALSGASFFIHSRD